MQQIAGTLEKVTSYFQALVVSKVCPILAEPSILFIFLYFVLKRKKKETRWWNSVLCLSHFYLLFSISLSLYPDRYTEKKSHYLSTISSPVIECLQKSSIYGYITRRYAFIFLLVQVTRCIRCQIMSLFVYIWCKFIDLVSTFYQTTTTWVSFWMFAKKDSLSLVSLLSFSSPELVELKGNTIIHPIIPPLYMHA